MRDERLLVKDILAALDRIDSYTKGMNFEAFVADEKTNECCWFSNRESVQFLQAQKCRKLLTRKPLKNEVYINRSKIPKSLSCLD